MAVTLPTRSKVMTTFPVDLAAVPSIYSNTRESVPREPKLLLLYLACIERATKSSTSKELSHWSIHRIRLILFHSNLTIQRFASFTARLPRVSKCIEKPGLS
jgi:hypothetical protein